MLTAQLMKLAENNNWKVHTEEQTVFGEYNGYLFTGLEGKNFKAFITSLAGISPDALQSLLGFLKDNHKVLRLRNFDITDNFLCVRIQEGLIPLSTDKMAYLLGQLSGVLALGDLAADACAVCGQPATRKGLYYGLYCHLHSECQDREPVDFTSSVDVIHPDDDQPNEPEPGDTVADKDDA